MEYKELFYLHRPPRLKMHHPPLLVLLHGQGGSEKDLFSLAGELDERLSVVSLRAPFELALGRYNWFGVEMLGTRLLSNAAHLEYSRQALSKFLPTAVDTLGTNPDQVYLFGFGQGAVIALTSFLANPELTEGVVGLDGQIPPEMASLAASGERFRGRSVLLMHGWQDEVYPIASAYAARELLARFPLRLDFREYPTGHYLSKDCVLDANDWLAERLDESRVSGTPEAPPFAARIGRVQLKVRSLDRAIPFYMRFLGLKLVERVGNAYALLGSGKGHHELVLQNVGAQAPTPHPDGVGLAHVSFELPDRKAFARAYRNLSEAGMAVKAVDHNVSWALAIRDLDGNGIELFWDARSLPGRSQLWQGRDLPLEAGQIIAALEEPEN